MEAASWKDLPRQESFYPPFRFLIKGHIQESRIKSRTKHILVGSWRGGCGLILVIGKISIGTLTFHSWGYVTFCLIPSVLSRVQAEVKGSWGLVGVKREASR